MSQTFFIKQGDLLPVITEQLLDDRGDVVTLSGCTVTFNLVSEAGSVKVNNQSATIVDSDLGIVRYAWQGTDTNTIGDFLREWVVTITASGSSFSVPNHITGYPVKVTADLN